MSGMIPPELFHHRKAEPSAPVNWPGRLSSGARFDSVP